MESLHRVGLGLFIAALGVVTSFPALRKRKP